MKFRGLVWSPEHVGIGGGGVYKVAGPIRMGDGSPAFLFKYTDGRYLVTFMHHEKHERFETTSSLEIAAWLEDAAWIEDTAWLEDKEPDT